ncbi:MAG: TetR/AcrR family transcriptional regulator [Bacteroidetes bacterium]|nr:TetR/AcrR family transcriptional regulator [Bacteroidota bacterium]
MIEVRPMEYNEKQLQIIDTAERLFAAKGFEGTSVRDIAQEAGINIAMISYYFGSKEKLIEAIFAYRISYTRLTIFSVINDNDISATEKMEKIVDSYIDKMMKNQCFYRLMAQERSILDIHNISELIYESKSKNMEMIKKLIAEGQKRGEFRKNIDTALLMATMIGTSNHFIVSQDFYKRYNNLKDMAEEDFQKLLKKKLGTYLKSLFKSILTHE